VGQVSVETESRERGVNVCSTGHCSALSTAIRGRVRVRVRDE